MARKSEARTKLVVGIFIVVLALLGGGSLFIIGQSEGTWETKTTLITDFKTITGLRKGSPVQLAGVEIGTVDSIEFKEVSYECDPATEDFGRYDGGRTDNCDPFLFCAPEGRCAELEPWASRGLHTPCLSNEDCTGEEICVTKQFRRRFRRVFWSGSDGVCARYITTQRRVRVTMNVYADKLEIIRSDSRATVAANSVLGDQLVNITPGRREPIPAGGRIQSTPSLYEDIELFRERIEGMTDKVDKSLAGISNLFSELNDERVISNIKGIVANVNEATRQVTEGDGLVGALFNDQQYKEDFGRTLRHIRGTAEGVDRFVARANHTLEKADANLKPLIDDTRATMAQMRQLLVDLKDPKNKSVVATLLYDNGGEGKMAKDLEDSIASMNKILKKLEEGEGSAGKFVNDPKAHDELVKLFDDLERNKVFKSLTRRIMQIEKKRDAARPTSSKRE